MSLLLFFSFISDCWISPSKFLLTQPRPIMRKQFLSELRRFLIFLPFLVRLSIVHLLLCLIKLTFKVHHIFLRVLWPRTCRNHNFSILLNPNLTHNPVIRLHLCHWWYICNVQNIFSEFCMFCPASQKRMRLKHIVLISQVTLHPLNVIILSTNLQLVRYQIT